ncbi:DUF1254 domain-containing protein [Amycolatopsis sp. NPDC101161]|uniref:DUF1254 domain-containing protein n=1 Tax=Amycolatopsis sp. NPDC101161 TaxID=3363940 RepID=UPI0037F7AF24
MPAGYEHLIILGVVAVAVSLPATYLYPRLLLIAYKRAILVKGVDSGPIPVNTLYTQPQALFRDPFAPLPPGGSRLMSMGTNRDTLYVAGSLDLAAGPLVLHVPDMGDRYYSVQFTDPATNTNFAYVGTRTTGTASGDHLVSGPRWAGTVPDGMGHVSAPHNAVLLIGRVFVADDDDLPTAYALARKIRLTSRKT